jgi:hypothetical protein
MLSTVNTALAFPEEQEVQLYDLVTAPAQRLGRWSVRRRRGISDSELEANAYGILSDLEELLALPPVEIRSRALADDEPGTDEAEELEALNALLAQVRACRGAILGPGGRTFERALRARRPQLADTYEAKRDRVLERLLAFEKMLVLLGAGTEDDAELGMDLIPQPDDLPPGPSVEFKL